MRAELVKFARDKGLLGICREVLVAPKNSLGIMHFLYVYFNVCCPVCPDSEVRFVRSAQAEVLVEGDFGAFLDIVGNFLLNSSPVQIRANAKLFVDLCRKFTEVL